MVEFAHDKDDGQTYLTGNLEILDQAQWLSELKTGAHAMVVWNGESRGEGDVTSHFMHEAGARGMGVAEVMTV